MIRFKVLVRCACALVLAGAAVDASVAQQRNEPRRPEVGFRNPIPTLAGSYLAGRQANTERDVNMAAEFFSRALQRDPRNTELLERTFVLRLIAGDMDDAVDLANRRMRLDPNDRLSRLVLSVRAIRERRFRQAVQLLRLPERGDISDLTGGLLAAWATRASGDLDEALALIERIRGQDWFDVFRNYHGGLMAEQSGRRAEAARRLQAAYDRDPNALRTVEAYARHLARAGDRTRALEVANQLLARIPANPILGALVAEISGNRPVAPLVRDSIRGAAEVLFGIGSTVAREGDEFAAIYLQLALHLDGDNGLALVSLAEVFQQMRRPQNALDAYERVPEASAMRHSAEVQMALTLDELERTDEAIRLLDRVLARAPNDLEALTTKGNILRGRRRFQEASVFYDRALAQVTAPAQRHWTLFYFRGMTFERTQRWPQAEADFRRALELQPEQPLVLNYLGYSWVDQGLHLEEAMRMLRRAVELRPNDGYIIDSVGWAYYRMGNFEQAVEWLERAIERKPSDPVINDHLGDAYWRVGRQIEARFQWQRARDSRPEPDDLVRIEQKLRDGLPDEPPRPVPAAGNTPPLPQPAPGQGG